MSFGFMDGSREAIRRTEAQFETDQQIDQLTAVTEAGKEAFKTLIRQHDEYTTKLAASE